ncbi:hypothetical protein [Halorussus marinus]|uniref:hypothetical protein n=1 Tax=Halorussus marinus TaxID=2505976 RepID=UPI0010922BA9|nr:hypothetical protein [Halorussus marinus]
MASERDGPDPNEGVHVRRLDVVDTLRWSWYALGDHLELAAVAFAVQLVGLGASLGVTYESPTDPPTVADWAWPASLAFAVGLVVVWGVCYLTAADAVAERTSPLAERLVGATKRVPAVIGASLLLWPLVSIGFALFVLPGLYLVHRLVLAYPACVIDGRGPLASLRSSWAVAGGGVWKIVGVSLVSVALTSVSVVVSRTIGAVSGPAALALSTGVSSALLALFGLAVGHLYLEASRNA